MITIPEIDESTLETEGESWSWLDALAIAHPGTRYRIERLLFSLVRDRCHRRGLDELDEVMCVANHGTHRNVVLRRSDGQEVELERGYAWFVQVRRVDRTNEEFSPQPTTDKV